MLQLIVFNTNAMLNRGINLDAIIRLGQFLRNKGDKVDFLKVREMAFGTPSAAYGTTSGEHSYCGIWI